MNRTYFRMVSALVAAFLFAACTQDELTNSTDALPEGMYPLQISGITLEAESSEQPWGADAPQTRVSESEDGNSSVWQNGDKINVQIGNGTPGVYTYTDGKLEVANGDAPAYWASTVDNQTITAWHSSSGTETVDLSNQTNRLAYALTAQTTANFNKSVSLTFSHALAKVRVLLTGTANMQEGTVQVKGYTQGTMNNGDVTGSNEGWITMHPASYNDGTVCYEANIIPGPSLYQSAFQVTQKNGNPVLINLDSEVQTSKGKIHEITLTVNKAETQEIKLSQQTENYIVNANASVVIDGGGTALSKRIIIEEGAYVMLKNVVLNAPSDGNTIEVQGTATLVLSGKNDIKGTDGCPLVVTNGTLTIDGTVNDRLTLTGTNAGCLGLQTNTNLIINGGHIIAKGCNNDAGIGSYYFGGKSCGSITINGGKVEADGGGGSAGIGAGDQCSCGDIIITGGNIIANGGDGWGGAGIGSGSSGKSTISKCGNITISGKNTVITATAGSESSDDIGIGDGGQCGTVTITDATVIATNGRIHGH